MNLSVVAKRLLQSTAARYGLQVERQYTFGNYRLDVLELLVEFINPKDPEFFFIQVGANDGESNDPINQMIRQYNWQGVLLEPQPDVYKNLLANYSSTSRLIFENAALALIDGEMPIWTVPGQSGLGSFSKDVLYRSGFKENQLAKQIIAAISTQTLLRKYNINRVDFLQIDTEGFDFEVIKMFMATELRPRIVHYEHLHLSDDDRKDCAILLGELGYKLLQVGEKRIDTVAFRH